MNNRKKMLFGGILGDNIVLSGLMVISPVIMCGDTLKNAEALIYAFSAITFLSVLISSFVPKKLPYTAKIIIYAVISSLVYIPVKLAAKEFYPDSIERIGIYYPLLAVNSLIVFQTEAKFFRMKKADMIVSLIFCILGFDIVMLITGFLRELFAYGTINSKIVDVNTLIGGLSQPFGGFIFLGLMCGAYRWIRSLVSKNSNARRGEDVSDK
ncbi:Rnf-Nqr domain containing protein [Ruminococcus flavefaciens]|uniref:Rnf-Nqr domain containing protein n=1 Tax=Ruminococcus flavefaciens TaxID=1265 RepID=UPI0026E9D106|nr:Rnf-Nqr domain containing protein [Ruminococcus flavefaciens]MDD7516639.1 Rnf-Nqr domain containing protein [Ruminococcus flavefaciens]MDY5691122.1 Rnf-Nqr domain containing protein [Ruminococcus flavefaciens]